MLFQWMPIQFWVLQTVYSYIIRAGKTCVCAIKREGLTKEELKQKHPSVFKGLGTLGKYHITLQDNCSPVINPARLVPHSLKSKLKQALERNVRLGVLKKVDQPTDWVSNLVIVEKKRILKALPGPNGFKQGNKARAQ